MHFANKKKIKTKLKKKEWNFLLINKKKHSNIVNLLVKC